MVGLCTGLFDGRVCNSEQSKGTTYWDNFDFFQFEILWPIEKYSLYDCNIYADNKKWQI